MALKIAFMGTPDFSVPALLAIAGAGHEIAAVYTQPPRAAGRGMGLRKCPVQVFAESRGFEVRNPLSLTDQEVQAEFVAGQFDVVIVVAYGLILPQEILDAPPRGCLNLHASLLPRWRGAAPIQRAVMAGDATTGIAVMRMEAGLDTGPVCLEEPMDIGADTTAGDLHDCLAASGARLMVRVLADLENRSLACIDQTAAGVTYAKKIAKAETRIDWTRPALEVHNHIRGLSPFPGAWFEIPAKKGPVRVKALRCTLSGVEKGGAPGELLGDGLVIACSGGAVRLCQVQRAGKAPTDAEDFARGANLEQGLILV